MSGYQVMPRLTPDEYDDLEQSILEHGVQVPITVGPDGAIIDGHHRDEIARKHDLHCPRVTAKGDAATLRGLAFSLNLDRRHLSREQKRQIVAESLAADPDLSDREHERRTGASRNVVGRVREEMEQDGRLSQSDSRMSGDGRVRPASQPPRPAPEPAPLPPGFNPGDLDERNTPAPDRPSRAIDDVPIPQRKNRTRITDQVSRAVTDMNIAAQRLTELLSDQRAQKHIERLAKENTFRLRALQETITDAIKNLEGENQ